MLTSTPLFNLTIAVFYSVCYLKTSDCTLLLADALNLVCMLLIFQWILVACLHIKHAFLVFSQVADDHLLIRSHKHLCLYMWCSKMLAQVWSRLFCCEHAQVLLHTRVFSTIVRSWWPTEDVVTGMWRRQWRHRGSDNHTGWCGDINTSLWQRRHHRHEAVVTTPWTP